MNKAGKMSRETSLGWIEINKRRLEIKEKVEEYNQWKSEWNGDYPDEREHMTFEGWLDKEDNEC